MNSCLKMPMTEPPHPRIQCWIFLLSPCILRCDRRPSTLNLGAWGCSCLTIPNVAILFLPTVLRVKLCSSLHRCFLSCLFDCIECVQCGCCHTDKTTICMHCLTQRRQLSLLLQLRFMFRGCTLHAFLCVVSALIDSLHRPPVACSSQ